MTTFGFASGAGIVVQNPDNSQVVHKRYQLQYVLDIFAAVTGTAWAE